jgi:ribosomal protein S12 methylthiotransferase
VLYAYPGYVTERLMQVMAERKQIVPYLDMPLQHAHPMTLRRMRRPANMDWVRGTLAKMRASIPGLALRTTFIVGYPGETEEEFQTLLDFVTETRFDHVGVFTFSFEPGTSSEPLGDPIPQEVKEERLARLVGAQESISLARNQSFVGQVQQVLIEGYNEGLSVGRAYHDAPEIDGLVFVEGKAEPGEIVKAQITGAMVHDLTARLI